MQKKLDTYYIRDSPKANMDQSLSKSYDAVYVGTVIYGKHALEVYDKLESEAGKPNAKAKRSMVIATLF